LLEEWHGYIAKAEENFEAAKHAIEQGWYNIAGSRAYYAVFHAAIALLQRFTSYRPDCQKGRVRWSHAAVQAQCSNLLVRTKILPAEHKSTLPELMGYRETADYGSDSLSKRFAKEALKKAKDFVKMASTRING
jgi:uncharacterized protein (UPF0332 family)